MPDFSAHCLINGHVPDSAEMLLDRGLQYGDGVFRTLAVHQGKLVDLEGQLKHLVFDAQQLDIAADVDVLQSDCERLALLGSGQNAALKITLTRGSSQRGYSSQRDLKPNRYLYLSAVPGGIQTLQTAGVKTVWNPTRLSHNPRLAGIKHLNRLEQVLARNAVNHELGHDSLMLDVEDRVIGGSQSNLFFVKDKQLFTPDLKQCGIAGRTRARIIELAAKAGYRTELGRYSRQDVLSANELFICNSLTGILPVVEIENTGFAIGEITQVLQQNLAHPVLS